MNDYTELGSAVAAILNSGSYLCFTRENGNWHIKTDTMCAEATDVLVKDIQSKCGTNAITELLKTMSHLSTVERPVS